MKQGIVNTPDHVDMMRIACTAYHMEHVRRLLNDQPINVSSWYRSDALNRAVGGSVTSAHRQGYAVDFTCSTFGDVVDVCEAIRKSCLQYDQLIWEKGRWCHISFAPAMRRQNIGTMDGKMYFAGFVPPTRGVA